MAPAGTFLALALAAALGAAAPSVHRRDLSDFVLKQVEVGDGYIRSAPLARLRAFERYGSSVPAPVLKLQQDTNDTVQAVPEIHDREFLVPVAVGSTGKILHMNMDTGSADLIAFSSQQPADELQGHSYYDPAASTSSKKLDGARWMVLYGDSSQASGSVYMDKVTLSGVTAQSQAVEAASSANDMLTVDLACDGIVGLGFSFANKVRPTAQKTFFDNVKNNLKQPIMAADLRRGAPGTYQFGAVDTGKFTGPISYLPVDSAAGHWTFTSGGWAIGADPATKQPLDLIVDTGTTGLYVTKELATAYYKRVPGSRYDSVEGQYVFPCGAPLPDLTFLVGNYKARMPGTYNNFAPTGTKNECFGNIQYAEGVDQNILGAAFLKSQYVVFNSKEGAPSIGFAAKPL